jgi:hypothetical protein
MSQSFSTGLSSGLYAGRVMIFIFSGNGSWSFLWFCVWELLNEYSLLCCGLKSALPLILVSLHDDLQFLQGGVFLGG